LRRLGPKGQVESAQTKGLDELIWVEGKDASA